jgi:transposase
MAYRINDRKQMELLPPSIEDYVREEDPVRAYDAFVDALNFYELGIEINPYKVGCPQYDPRAMLKLLIYGYSYGIRSSRKLERATHHNISFIWLTSGLKPDHKTIAEFRRKNKKALSNVLKQCARLCIKLGLIDGNTLFIDGSKIRGNASIKNSWTKKKCAKVLSKIDRRIEAILAECETIDQQEADRSSLVKMDEDLINANDLKSKVKQILKTLEDEEKISINTVDPDCTRTNSIHGCHAGYNAQIAVDEKHGLIVSSEVVGENNDLNQFANQVNQANETLEKKCKVACADSGYAATDTLEEINDQKIVVVVPSQRQASKKEPGQFDKRRFQYDSDRNCYICPEGHIISYRRTDYENKFKIYQFSDKMICRHCCNFGKCTKSLKGRQIKRLVNEEMRQKLEAQYERPECQAIYSKRKEKVELPFGHIKRNLKLDAFLLRGRDGVNAEFSLLGSSFNIVRMINILGIGVFINQIL